MYEIVVCVNFYPAGLALISFCNFVPLINLRSNLVLKKKTSIRRLKFHLYGPKRKKTYIRTCVHNEDSNQPAHPRSLIRVSVVRMKQLCILGYPKCAQPRFRSDCANAQSDLNLRWALIFEGTFLDVTALIQKRL